jgi:chorismate mutase
VERRQVIEQARARLDEIDRELVALLRERAIIARRINRARKSRDSEREQQVLAQVRALTSSMLGGYDAATITEIWEAMFRAAEAL